jgi:DUF4097 and DUF4098 domain-containing protein YvlB
MFRKSKKSVLFPAVLMLSLAAPALLRADYRSEKHLKLDPGGRLVVDSSDGSVTVTGEKESGARVLVTANRDDVEQYLDFRYEENAGEVRIVVRRRHEGWFGSNWGHHGLNLHIEVGVPEETSLNVKTGGGSVEASRINREAELDTSGGSIRASELGANLRAHTSGGSITIERIKGNARVDTSGGGITGESLGGTLDARTSGGSIDLRQIKGDLLAHTSGGSIGIEDAGGRVDADTSGGSVEVRFTHGNSRGGEIESSGGGVRVALDRSANVNLDASTSAGSVVTDLPITVSGTLGKSHVVGTVGSGGALLKVHSSAGSVRIEAL